MTSRKLRGRTENSKNTRDADDDNSSSDDDLPSLSSLSFLFSPTKAAAPKSQNQKSIQELLEEHTNLAQTIKGDNISQSHVEEKLKRIKIEEPHHEEKEPEPAPIVEEDYNIFCVYDVLQFFNSRDVTPALCGYSDTSKNLSVHEKDMLSFIRVELENVISSFLLTCDPCAISDCKSFVTFLLRSISVSSDTACINACYYTLISMLTDHPHAESISFSSAEIFMVLFNYGIDVENCQILQYRPGLKKQLSAPTSQSKSCNRIPENWTFNLEYILRSLIKLMSTCDIKSKDLCNILIFFLWMSLDPKLHAGNLYPILQECISASVEHVPEDRWTITLLDIANTLVSMDFPSEKLKWNTIYSLAESIPSLSQKCGYLRRQISFLALSHLCYGEKADISSDSKFTIEEFKNLLQQMVEIQSDSSLSLAANFVDLYASHLNAKEEEYNDLCVILKRSENTLHEKAHMAKSHLCKIHSRLKRMACKSSVYPLSSFKKSSIYNLVKVKKEKDIKPKDDTCILDPVRIKVESNKHPNNVKSEKQDDINMFAVEEPVYVEDSFHEEKFSPVKQPEGFIFQEFVTNQLSMLNNNNEVTPKASEEKSNLSSNQKSLVNSVEENEVNFISLSSCSLLNSTLMHSDSKKLDVFNEKENNEEVKMKMSVHVKTHLATEKSTDHIPPLNTDKHIKTQSISKVVGCSPKNSLAIKRKSDMKISDYSNILNPNKNKSNIPEQSIKKDSSIPFSKMNLKRKDSEPSSIAKIQRVSSPRKSEGQSENHPKHFRNKSSFAIQLTPKKSNLLGQNICAIDKVKSPFKCTFRLSPKKPLFGVRRNLKSQPLLSKTGLHLPQYFRETLLPSSSQSKSNSIPKVPEIFENSDSDSDIVVLYTDPKKYSDSDCMIVYETEEQVVLD